LVNSWAIKFQWGLFLNNKAKAPDVIVLYIELCEICVAIMLTQTFIVVLLKTKPKNFFIRDGLVHIYYFNFYNFYYYVT